MAPRGEGGGWEGTTGGEEGDAVACEEKVREACGRSEMQGDAVACARARVGGVKRCVANLLLAMSINRLECRLKSLVPATWHQGRWDEEGMPRGTKGGEWGRHLPREVRREVQGR